MKLLHVIGDCNPAMGGAIEGVLRLGDAYRALGHDLQLLTLDSPDDPWVEACPTPVTAMGRSGARKIFYPGSAISWLCDNLASFDGVVVDGLWNSSTLAARRVLPGSGVPYAVFPHGMLDPWFRQHQPVKEAIKRFSFRVIERPLLAGARAALFTTQQERELARQAWPGWEGIAEQVVGFGTGEPPARGDHMTRALRECIPDLSEQPFLLFLSRIHPKKGCEILLKGFAERQSSDLARLVMAGPGDADYVASLQKLARELGIADQVLWPGMLSADAKWGALYGCEAMVLSSYQENFGVVVAEAMACARPVIISDQVNIQSEVKTARAGLVCQANAASVTGALNAFTALPAEERLAMGHRGRALFETSFTMTGVAERIVGLFSP